MGVFEIIYFVLNDNCVLFLKIIKKLYLCISIKKVIIHNS